jgi:hypothetical protein
MVPSSILLNLLIVIVSGKVVQCVDHSSCPRHELIAL